MMQKIILKVFLLGLVMFFMTSCLEEKNKNTETQKAVDANGKEEDCDDEVAQKTLEKLKAEEYSLMNQNDAGCSTEEAKDKKEIELPKKN
jgi:hypothetical protein